MHGLYVCLRAWMDISIYVYVGVVGHACMQAYMNVAKLQGISYTICDIAMYSF